MMWKNGSQDIFIHSEVNTLKINKLIKHNGTLEVQVKCHIND